MRPHQALLRHLLRWGRLLHCATVSVDLRSPERRALRAASGSHPSGCPRRLGASQAKHSSSPLYESATALVLPRRPLRERPAGRRPLHASRVRSPENKSDGSASHPCQ